MKMKQLVAVACVLLASAGTGILAECTTIQDGVLQNSAGEYLAAGYDHWGYNYQADVFNGKYCDAYRDAAWCQPYKDEDLQMKWNDAWLSKSDCDGDGLLDRHYGFTSYKGSGAWLTNHQKGSYAYTDDRGKLKTAHWFYFIKIVAVPADATLASGYWYEADGSEIGPEIWGEFAVIEEVYNDPVGGATGLQYHSPANSGLATYGPQQN